MREHRFAIVALLLCLAVLVAGCDAVAQGGVSEGPKQSPAPPSKPQDPPSGKPEQSQKPQQPSKPKGEPITREKANAVILELLNAERARLGLAKLSHSQVAEDLAQRRADALAAALREGKCGLTHDIPGLGRLYCGSECIACGTNESPDSAFRGLMNSPPHKAIMLNPDTRVLGVGFVPDVRVVTEGWTGNLYVLVLASAEASQHPGETSRDAVTQTFLELVNRQRRQMGLADLVLDQDLHDLAQSKAEELISSILAGRISRDYPYLGPEALNPTGARNLQIWATDVQSAFNTLAKTPVGFYETHKRFGLGFVPNFRGPNDNGMPMHLYVVLVRND